MVERETLAFAYDTFSGGPRVSRRQTDLIIVIVIVRHLIKGRETMAEGIGHCSDGETTTKRRHFPHSFAAAPILLLFLPLSLWRAQ